MWHVSSRSGEAYCELLYSVYLTLPYLYLYLVEVDGKPVEACLRTHARTNGRTGQKRHGSAAHRMNGGAIRMCSLFYMDRGVHKYQLSLIDPRDLIVP